MLMAVHGVIHPIQDESEAVTKGAPSRKDTKSKTKVEWFIFSVCYMKIQHFFNVFLVFLRILHEPMVSVACI